MKTFRNLNDLSGGIVTLTSTHLHNQTIDIPLSIIKDSLDEKGYYDSYFSLGDLDYVAHITANGDFTIKRNSWFFYGHPNLHYTGTLKNGSILLHCIY